MTINVPRLVHRDGHFNVVFYDGKYYRVPLSLGRVLVDAMTPEQEAAVRCFRSLPDAIDDMMSYDLRGKLLIRVNVARKINGKQKISRAAATSRLRGAQFNSEDAIVNFLANL